MYLLAWCLNADKLRNVDETQEGHAFQLRFEEISNNNLDCTQKIEEH